MSLLISSPHKSYYSLSIIASVLGVEVVRNADFYTLSDAVHSRLISRRASLIVGFSKDHPTQYYMLWKDWIRCPCIVNFFGDAARHTGSGLSYECPTQCNNDTFCFWCLWCAPMGALSIACQSVVSQQNSSRDWDWVWYGLYILWRRGTRWKMPRERWVPMGPRVEI
jgi:hypothetical protein